MKPEKTDPKLVDLIAGFGERLKAARLAARFSQAAFARALGVSPQRLANWEAGDNPPNVYHLAMMKQRFGIGADWILSGDAGALSARALQAMVTLGAGTDAPEAARELRAMLPDLNSPTADHARNTLHDATPQPPGRLVRPTDIQDG